VFDLDHWHEILQSLRRNRLRTLLTACGVFWGVFMLVVMLGFAGGLQKGVEGDFSLFNIDTVFVWGQQTGMAYAGRQPGRPVPLTVDDAERVRKVEGVAVVLPRNFLGGMGGGTVVTRREKSQSFAVSGEEEDYLRLEPLDIARGRFLNPADLAERRKVAVVGRRVVSILFDDGTEPLGARIAINGISFQVVGLYQADESGARGDWLAGRIFIPRTTFVRTFAQGDRISGMALLMSGSRPSSEVEEEVRRVLRGRHQIHPDDVRALGSFNREKEFRKVDNLFLAIKAVGWFVGVLTLLAGALGVSNIMMIVVAERTREIGIRKAVGATPANVVTQIVAESTVLTALAGYVGLVAAVGVLELVATIMRGLPASGNGPRMMAPPEVELSKAVLAAVVLTVAGAAAGLAPARAAVAIRPVDALAHD
jgi:putative ABC transport system permease protein